jgi:hypothetical protein
VNNLRRKIYCAGLVQRGRRFVFSDGSSVRVRPRQKRGRHSLWGNLSVSIHVLFCPHTRSDLRDRLDRNDHRDDGDDGSGHCHSIPRRAAAISSTTYKQYLPFFGGIPFYSSVDKNVNCVQFERCCQGEEVGCAWLLSNEKLAFFKGRHAC